MYRAIPTSSKLLQRYWNDRNHQIHRRNLRNVRSTIDNSCPPSINPANGTKKYRILEGSIPSDRYSSIERDNRIMLERMARSKS